MYLTSLMLIREKVEPVYSHEECEYYKQNINIDLPTFLITNMEVILFVNSIDLDKIDFSQCFA